VRVPDESFVAIARQSLVSISNHRSVPCGQEPSHQTRTATDLPGGGSAFKTVVRLPHYAAGLI
jgi:hypothetical protein